MAVEQHFIWLYSPKVPIGAICAIALFTAVLRESKVAEPSAINNSIQ
jgi:hypothetical protein